MIPTPVRMTLAEFVKAHSGGTDIAAPPRNMGRIGVTGSRDLAPEDIQDLLGLLQMILSITAPQAEPDTLSKPITPGGKPEGWI